MCGRYIFYDGKNPDILILVRRAEEILPKELFERTARGEVFPGSLCFAGCRKNGAGTLHTEIMRWGIAGFRSGTVINARSETAFSSPFFRGMRTCVLPASGYYEWDSRKTKYLFTADIRTIYLAGLYRIENGEKKFVILTEPAAESLALIHSRQPVVFDRKTAEAWCLSDEPMPLLPYSLQNRSADKA